MAAVSKYSQQGGSNVGHRVVFEFASFWTSIGYKGAHIASCRAEGILA